MTQITSPTPRMPARSMGLKLLLVCALALIMSVTALFVFLLLYDRTQRAQEVTREIGQLVGGEQTFLGPVLAVPYTTPPLKAGEAPGYGVYLIFPTTGEATADTRSEVRQRSLFKVPVWQADLKLTSGFDLSQATALGPGNAQYDWDRAEFLVGVTDPRGARSDAVLVVGERRIPLAPAVLAEQVGGESTGNLRMFGARIGDPRGLGEAPSVQADLKFSGAERLSVLPWAKTTRFLARDDWPHPSFDGGFLPATRTIREDGFEARWSVPFIARGVPQEGDISLINRLSGGQLGVSFVELTNPYQSVGRSLKYAPMFMGLVFLAFFIFESTTRRRVHPAQYVLLGLAQIVFYLLLLSIAERTGFDPAFLVAAGATVLLISAYARWVFESVRQGIAAFISFSVLYGLIYALMRLEDLALLIGALASFAAIAAAMFFTRRIDWYGSPAQAAPAGPSPFDPPKAS
ncbi:MAG TPA: cell envelope integrity protein CreD [Caulobacter sp.]|nr:cell envelope integrity protein CreD [Caulobacter sp.]